VQTVRKWHSQGAGCSGADEVSIRTVYEPKDAPRYNKGNKVLLGIIAWNLVRIRVSASPSRGSTTDHKLSSQVVAYPFAYFYYRWRNHSNAKVWNAMTSEEKSHYLATTKKEGNQR
jgi:hypothetical protein